MIEDAIPMTVDNLPIVACLRRSRVLPASPNRNEIIYFSLAATLASLPLVFSSLFLFPCYMAKKIDYDRLVFNK